MTIVVTGGLGGLGSALGDRGAGTAYRVLPQSRAQVDVCNPAAVRSRIRALGATVVINCAAYTAVDLAEIDREAAFAVNTAGAGDVAIACAEIGIPMIHVSTDYVFDGRSQRPYREDDPIAPISVYGESKAAGEAIVRAAGGIVVRTSWLFSHRAPSFVRTIVRAALTQPTLRVVDDQIGCPTYADDLADALLALADRAVRGAALERSYHACNAGPITWCGFARAIVAEARKHREIACGEVTAITTAEYPTAARRPAYSVLDTSRLCALGIVMPSWDTGLGAVVPELIA